MRRWVWGAVAVAIGAINAAIGCSSGSGNTGFGGSGGGLLDTSSSGSPTTTSGGVVTDGGMGSQCAANRTTCPKCCQDTYDKEDQILFNQYVFPMCACATGDAGSPSCAAECADNLCANKPIAMTCNTCLNTAISNFDLCYHNAVTACDADPMCKGLLGCVDSYCN